MGNKCNICLYLLLLSLNLSSQITSFRNIVSGGIVDFKVNCLFKDSKGFIWTGGSYKIQRFDGNNFLVFDKPQGVGNVNTISESIKGQLYFGTSEGLYSLKRNSAHLEPVLSSQVSDNINSIYIDSINNIYAGTDDGLVIISNDSIERVNIQNPDFPFDQILSIKYISKQFFLLLTPGGIVAFNPETKKHNYYPTHSKNNNSYCKCFTRIDSIIYIGTRGDGIYTFNMNTGVTVPFMNVGNGSISSISSNKDSILYVGTAGTGVYVISTPEKRIIRSFNSNPKSTEKLSSDMITDLLIDDFGILWVGSGELLGFDYIFLDPKPFMIYSTPSFSTFNVPVNSFYFGNHYKLLTGLHGLYYISDKDGSVEVFEAGIGKAQCLKPGKVLSIVPYGDEIILGGECGIYTFDPANLSLKIFEGTATLNNSTINNMHVDSIGNLWIASSTGLSIYNAKTNYFQTYNTINSNLPDDFVRFIYTDKNLRTWICTKKGICFWNDQKKNFYFNKFPDGFIDKKYVHYIMEDRKGNFLFCYDEREVLFSAPDFKKYRQVCTEEDAGFTGLRILKILQEKSGIFWFIGSRGATKVNESLTDFDMYSISEGLYEPYATDGHFDTEERLWLSNNKGLYYASDNFSKLDAPMVITDIKVNGHSEINELQDAIEKNELIEFKHHKNSIEFQFALLDYTRPDLMVYECKLLGIDDGWTILRGIDKIAYKALKPGYYTFVVRHNMDKKTTKEVHFKIKPILNLTEYILIVVFVIGIGLYAYYRLKMKKKHISINVLDSETNKSDEQKYQYNKISQKKAEEIISRLKICMENKKMYLNENLNMSDLAKEVECSNQILSQVFNLYLNEKYNEYINRYRINEFKHIISSTDHSIYTLRSLAQKSGFSSYTSFYRAFKEQTGITPNDFIKNLNT